MKKAKIIIPIFSLAIFYICLKDSTLLQSETNYVIVSNEQKTVPAKLYYRNVDMQIDDKKENVYEILIFFDEDLNMELNPIVVVPKYKLIGVVEGGENGFLNFGSKVIQFSENSNQFTTLENSAFFDDPPIKKIKFEENSISFNSFKQLKKYGKDIILKKK